MLYRTTKVGELAEGAAGRSGLRAEMPVVVAALLLVASAGFAQDAEDLFQPWHAITLRSVGAVAFSPNGEDIAYVVSEPRKPLEDDSGPAWRTLHLRRADGTSASFVTGEANVGGVAWRPDGKEISFLEKRDKDEQRALYSISIAGGEAQKLFEHETAISAYRWHPDGCEVAFLAVEKRPEEHKELADKGFNQEIYEEDRVFTRLYVVDLEAEEPEAKQLEVDGSVRSVRWTPDGKNLVITVTPTPLIDDSYVKQKVRVLDREGKQVAEIDNPGKLGAVKPSPSSDALAMISAADLNDPAAGRLLVAVHGNPLRDVLPELEGHVSGFAWKDNDTLVYIADIGVETEVGMVRRDGSGRKQILAAGTAVSTSIELSPDGERAAMVASRPEHPSELYLLDLDSGRARRGTDSNPWLDNLRLARQEPTRFKAQDGLELDGLLIYPIDYQEGRRYPLIMVVHGGPESHFRNGWLTGYSQFGQIAAARGFAVFYPNYRGSTGRGVEFSKISQADAAGKEFSDLVDAVDHLIAIGLVDRDHVGITGGSYGGYASSWATTYYSDRFAAAIPFVGISNNISKVGTTDIPWEMYQVHHRKWLWQDWSYFAERSPIYYAERNRTPTLILHGKEDPRVHPSQSLELYRHLKVLGQAPVRLVLYPGEGHGNRKSAARLDYLLRTLRWMEHYLQGPGGEPPPQEIDYGAVLPWVEDSDTGSSGSSTGAP